MSMFAGCECPYCKRILTDEDDLAVCPECGTPHHRDCFRENGACANAHAHVAGFEWRRPLEEEDVATDIACPACGRLNTPDNMFCNHCGADIRGATEQLDGAYAEYEGRRSTTSVSGGVLGELNLMANFSSELYGFSLEDWKTYIGSNQYYYLYHLDRQAKTGKKLSFTIGAALFPFLYFIYRKLWWPAIVSFAASMIVSVPILLNELAAMYGGAVLGVSPETWALVGTIATFVLFAIQLMFGFLALGIYKRTAVRRMSALHAESATPEEYAARLKKIGGPSKTALICTIAVYIGVWLCTAVMAGLFG